MEDIQVEAQDAIYDAAFDCRNKFDSASRQMKSGRRTLKDLQQRFWAWSNNSGVFAEPFVSLDARLEGHSEPRTMTLRLLGLIQKNLKAGELIRSPSLRCGLTSDTNHMHLQQCVWMKNCTHPTPPMTDPSQTYRKNLLRAGSSSKQSRKQT